jgi:hypothetical protein
MSDCRNVRIYVGLMSHWKTKMALFGYPGLENLNKFLSLMVEIGAFPVKLLHSQETLSPDVVFDL